MKRLQKKNRKVLHLKCFCPSFNDHVPVYITSSYMWLLVAHTITRRNGVRAADVQNPIHTCNDFFLSHPLPSSIYFVCGWSEFGSKFICVHYEIRVLWQQFSNVRILFYYYCHTLNCKLAFSLVVLKYIGFFSRAGDAEWNGTDYSILSNFKVIVTYLIF